MPIFRFLLLRYQTHCNVEVCAHFRCFKYVYKYTFKAPDTTAIAIDEIETHLAGRLLSVSEAVHRLLSLSLHKEWPPVVRLDIHLPQQHTMVFDPTTDEESLMLQSATTTSTLLAFFRLNAADAFAKTLLYHEVPEHYVWVDGRWRKRVYSKVPQHPLPSPIHNIIITIVIHQHHAIALSCCLHRHIHKYLHHDHYYQHPHTLQSTTSLSCASNIILSTTTLSQSLSASHIITITITDCLSHYHRHPRMFIQRFKCHLHAARR
jgi:hypothetical protein